MKLFWLVFFFLMKILISRLVGNGIDISEEDSLGFTANQLAMILGKDYLVPYLDGETVVDENDEVSFFVRLWI